ncbi:MAG: FAD:protein FMN transferase [Flavobacteriales bacterium]|nr:FAD:protein FMN transferase [Flavobacteriales bacterium]
MLRYSAIFFTLLLFGCTQQEPQTAGELFGEAQGTTYSIKYYANQEITKASVDSILLEIDYSMSTWVDSSMISKFNNSERGAWVDQRFMDNLNLSFIVNEMTNGAFNPMIKPIINYWGFGEKKLKVQEIDSTLVASLLGYSQLDSLKIESNGQLYDLRNISLSSTKPKEYFVQKHNRKVMLDFNAVAQGYSVDVLAQFFESRGVKSYLIELGGEMRARGLKPDESEWVVGIDLPQERIERTIAAKINLKDQSVATSGNYRKFYEVNGAKFHHTIDPLTGYPAKHNLLSATIVAENCALADAFATSCMVMGLEKSIDFIERQSGAIEAHLIFVGDSLELKSYTTKRLKENLESTVP